MAILFGNQSTKLNNPTASPISWAHNHNSTFVKSVLVVGVAGQNVQSSMTYGGQAMTLALDVSRLKWFVKFNPLTGSNNIVLAGASGQGIIAWARSFDFVDSEAGLDNTNTINNLSPPVNMNVSGVEVNSLYFLSGYMLRYFGSHVDISNTNGAFYEGIVDMGGENYGFGTFQYKTGSPGWTSVFSSPYSNNLWGSGLELHPSKKILRAIEF